MVRIEFTDRARLDLREIARFGTHVWDRERAAAYVAELRAAIVELETFPEIGPLHRNDELGAIRRLVHRRHVIFYRYRDETIVIARVLSVRAALSVTSEGDEHSDRS